CARELGIKPIDDMMKKMGISDEDLDNLTSEMMSAFGGAEGIEGMMSPAKDEDDEDDDGRTATFPFLNQLFGSGSPSSPAPSSGESSSPPPSRSEKNSGAKPAKRKFLDSYCISLTQRAQEGKLDRLIGRERELERVVQILNRRQKNNPCLIGEPGVGKTAIAEGLAQRIAARDVPYKLLDKEVYLLDLTALVAGTQFRGQFESRMKGLIEEIRKLGNIILVIDEVHTIVGAGDAEGSMNAANILKPALSRGELQVIGATTLNEYRKHIEKDTALERRFQPVMVEEPSIEDSVKVIEGIVPYYESFHQVEVSPAMCRLAVTMSERYITDRYLPDKAIDLIDEACSNVNLHNKALARLNAVEKELADLAKEKEVMMAAATDEAYERLAAIKSMELRLDEEKQGLENEAHPALTQEHLANVIELWTNIPASRIQEQEFQRLAKLEARLEEHVIGQNEAVKAVSSAIRRGRVGISPKRKPVSFIFVGSTGVGKTELVKQLAADLFDSPDSLVRLDMSEFMEKHAVSRMIGSPPGYVGYDEAGQLTEKIRRKPYSVVLFDEIEKAHPDVLNILLQVLDDGRITDAHGRTVNFENTVIVMTTNAGSGSKVGSVGFGRTANEQGKDRALKALNDFLRPEFINRVDEIVYFNQLSEDNFKGIAVLMLKELVQTLKDKEINFTWDETLLDYLVKKSYSAAYGARNLRRLIQKELEDAIAVRLIEGYQNPVSQLKAVSNGETLELLAL
ncbi:MAG: ATP-dependent Clp protease ATP-binding subunit, partial [Lawsonibacter sp.]|nr:ATP-dependent Clp protease ATP-binding subunit [Lawsonibacter sp.]